MEENTDYTLSFSFLVIKIQVITILFFSETAKDMPSSLESRSSALVQPSSAGNQRRTRVLNRDLLFKWSLVEIRWKLDLNMITYLNLECRQF